MQLDLELALLDATTETLVDLVKALPPKYVAEDRTSKGWGVVVRSHDESPADPSDAVESFLGPLLPLATTIARYKGVLRVGAFHDTVTCTLWFRSSQALTALGLALEVSTYPSED